MKKRYDDFPLVSFVTIICVVISSFILFVSLPKSSDEYISLNRTVETTFIENDVMHIKFIEDDIDYVFYEYGDVVFEDLNDLKHGDTTNIFVDKNYQKPKSAIIYKLVVDNHVIYDSIEYYYHHDMAIVNAFAPAVIGLLLTHLFVVRVKVREKKVAINDSKNFIIKNPAIHISFGVVVSVFGMIPFTSFLVQYLCKLISVDLFNFSYIFLLFMIMGFLFVYISIIGNFKLKNGIYSYQHPFRKQSIKMEKIDHVEIYLSLLCRVTFYDINGKKAISFRDNGLTFSNGYLIRSLKNNNIKYEYRTKTEVIQK